MSHKYNMTQLKLEHKNARYANIEKCSNSGKTRLSGSTYFYDNVSQRVVPINNFYLFPYNFLNFSAWTNFLKNKNANIPWNIVKPPQKFKYCQS